MKDDKLMDRLRAMFKQQGGGKVGVVIDQEARQIGIDFAQPIEQLQETIAEMESQDLKRLLYGLRDLDEKVNALGYFTMARFVEKELENDRTEDPLMRKLQEVAKGSFGLNGGASDGKVH